MGDRARGETLRAYSERMGLPYLLTQWDAEKNAPLSPDTVSPKSRKRVWWRCAEGHVWQARIFSRTGAQKSGCPVCAGRVGKKRLKRMQELEEAARASRAGRQLPLPERFIAAQNIQIPRDSAI